MNFFSIKNINKISFTIGIFIIGIILPLIIRNIFYRHLLVLIIIYSILALSLDIVIGHMGQFTFGHQAFFGLAAYISGILSVNLGLPIIVSALSGIMFSTALGFIVGIASLKNARGFLLGIITLGVGRVLMQISIKASDITSGTAGFSFIPKPSIWIPFYGKFTIETEIAYYYFAIFWLIVTIYLIYSWKRSRFGRAVEFIRENELLARSIGINPFSFYVGAFTFASFISGLSGVLYTHYITTISPDTLSMSTMVSILAIVILGGKRTFLGPIIGSIIFISLPQLFSGIREYRMIIVGFIILISIIFLKNGIVPTIARFLESKVLERKIKKNGNS